MPVSEQSPTAGFAEDGAAGLGEILVDEERRIEAHAGVRIWPRFVTAEENSVTCPSHQFIGDFVRQPDTGSEIIGIGRNQSRSGRRLHGNNGGQLRSKLGVNSLGNDEARRLQIEISLLLLRSLMVVKSS